MAVTDRRVTGFLFLALCIFSTCAATNHLVLDYNSPESAREAGRVLDLIIAGDASDAIRTDNRTWILQGYASLLNRTQLDHAIRTAPETLSKLYYQLNVPIKTSTLQALDETQAGYRLYYDIPFSYWDFYDKHVPDVQSAGSEPFHSESGQQRQHILQYCSDLYSVTAHMNYGSDANFDDMPFLYDILTNCPGVRELDLAITHSGCVVSHYESAFDFAESKKMFAPLESLKLSGYDLHYTPAGERRYGAREFQRGSTPNTFKKLASTVRLLASSLHRLGIRDGLRDFYNFMMSFSSYPYETRSVPGPEVAYDNLDVWLQRMDWSRLRHLDLGHVDMDKLKTVVASGASPESLVLHRSHCCSPEEEYSDLVRSLTNPLKHLKVKDVAFEAYDELIDALSPTGDNLESLTVTEGEYNRDEYCSSRPSEEHCLETFGTYYLPRPFLNASQLHQISQQNANISALEVDIARIVPDIEDRSTWSLDHAALKAAAMLPQLTHLKVNIEPPDHLLVRAGRASEYPGLRRQSDSKQLPPFSHDPSLNRTSVPALFESVNGNRQKAGLVSLGRLDLNVGQWSQRFSDWGMLGPPGLMIGDWVCEAVDGGELSWCYGGNDHLDYADIEDPYSEDWSVPDPVRVCGWGSEDFYDHNEL
ncbi:hypothetical protein CLAFUW4_03171 [Fulvia fulva]|uniref:Uncharacterized protein n=1 Tax=Passalora fulva TaxID=5499 RepID=A0A9Q8LBM5_PASFU|nr:uncharacterized protein CLAFUR5_03155 [Fulvia fulva]KAK4631555.1 hypothetical protein CLAFUR4_03160 [Fulvia fulva]UJO13778.1 hypothetical protein CLAFUR5_03155 [Fulvia fulva]WPV10578.1 hypothetical protein CLAFUW4_03171 [Fulvia fulva]WPV26810.1 hypothetical protein CLAFUW7_03164 [Fulvia fulva]